MPYLQALTTRLSPPKSPKGFLPRNLCLGVAALASIAVVTTHPCQAAPKPSATKRSEAAAPAKAPAPKSADLELVTLDEMQLGKGAAKAPPARRKDVAAAPKDSLDGLLNHNTRAEPTKAPAATKERMQFPGEKEKAAAPPVEKAEVVAPDRVTSEVTAKALAAATASAAKQNKAVPASATVPKLPPKMKLNDDPLAGMSEKEQRSQAQNKGQKKASKDGI